MDAVTVTCYDTKNRDLRPNEDLFYQFYPNYLPAFLFESLFLSINQNLLPRGESWGRCMGWWDYCCSPSSFFPPSFLPCQILPYPSFPWQKMKQSRKQQQRRKRRERKRITSLHIDDLNVDDDESDAPFKQQQQPSKQDELHSGSTSTQSPPPHHSLLLFTLVCRPQIRFFEQQRQEHKLGVVLVAISVLFICCHAPSVR